MSIITSAIQKYRAIQLDLEMKNEDYMASSLFQNTDIPYKQESVESFLTFYIEELRERGKVGNSYAYLNLRTTLHN